ncbi:unnamed protein product [Oikopleura dioica]|uniref:Uncharacterized protein n=1 Tax=Oikopleura dioica TaxID=34765 RepID=E4XMY4_OIKDI|nr:unnamed protein product [Oikopleura dioica]CBY32315.1 unnamed protein product [Oikopleura dioica]
MTHSPIQPEVRDKRQGHFYGSLLDPQKRFNNGIENFKHLEKLRHNFKFISRPFYSTTSPVQMATEMRNFKMIWSGYH